MTAKQVTMLASAIGGMSLALGGAAGTWAGGERVQNEVDGLKAKVHRLQQNQKVLDLQMRLAAQEAEWANDKLDKLLSAQNIDRPPRPPLPTSELDTVLR